MALVDVQQSWSRSGGGREQGDGIDNFRSWSAEGYTALFDAVGSTQIDALTGTGVPQIGDTLAADVSQKAQRYRAVPLGPYLWEIIVEYGGKNSPLSEAYERSWTGQMTTEAIDEDADGDPIENVVGERLVGVTADFVDQIYTVSRNELVFPRSLVRLYQNSINEDDFIGYLIGEVRIGIVSGRRIVDGETYYWNVTYPFICRTGGWRTRMLNEGRRHWTGKLTSSGAKHIGWVKLGDGQNTPTPVKLAADGKLLGSGDDDVWLEFDLKPDRNYGLLGLD